MPKPNKPSTPMPKVAVENYDDQNVSMKVVRELMRVQQEAIMACFNNVIENVSSKVDNIIRDVQEIKTSMEFTSDMQNTKIKNVNERIDEVKKELTRTSLLNADDRLKQQKEKVVDLEDRSRRNNLRLDGIEESEKETWEETEEKMKSLFREKLLIRKDIEIDRAHRVGRK